MVWSQYVYDANYGTDVIDNDDEEYDEHDDTPLHIDDWRDFYSYELEYMWSLLNGYIEQSYLNNTLLRNATYEDFVRFCFNLSDRK